MTNHFDADNEAWFLAGLWWAKTHPDLTFTESLENMRIVIRKAQEIKNQLIKEKP